jgi:hypothetical protein
MRYYVGANTDTLMGFLAEQISPLPAQPAMEDIVTPSSTLRQQVRAWMTDHYPVIEHYAATGQSPPDFSQYFTWASGASPGAIGMQAVLAELSDDASRVVAAHLGRLRADQMIGHLPAPKKGLSLGQEVGIGAALAALLFFL